MNESHRYVAKVCVCLLIGGTVGYYFFFKSNQPICTGVLKNNQCIARVHNAYLYEKDIDLSHVHALPISDAHKKHLMNHYIETWACHKLLAMQASHADDMCTVQQQVRHYQEHLLAHTVLDQRIRQELKDTVSKSEIMDYYHKHQDDFLLNQDIVKGIFVAIPRKAVGINRLKSWMLSNHPSSWNQLKAFCAPYVQTCILRPDQWIPWEEVLHGIGFHPQNRVRLLQTNAFIHTTSLEYVFLLKIAQYKLAKEVAPLEMVEKQIRTIILHKRRRALELKIKNDLLHEAKKKNEYVHQLVG